jgi:hypothetical protein
MDFFNDVADFFGQGGSSSPRRRRGARGSRKRRSTAAPVLVRIQKPRKTRSRRRRY